MIKLILDNRETQLISLIKDRDLDKYTNEISIETQQLDIGDIHVVTDTRTLIFERKTVNDLLSSVKDGRYKEQKLRLLSSGYDITYIIEGDDVLSSKNQRNIDLLLSIYMYSMYRDNIHLVFTKNINDTCTFLLSLCVKMIQKPDKFVKSADNSEYIEHVSHIKTKKIENITPDNCYLMQLSQIPSISICIAKNIQKHYVSMRDLIKALNDIQDHADRIVMLCQIDKIGKEKAKKILEYLSYDT